jgi:hypothetical protein
MPEPSISDVCLERALRQAFGDKAEPLVYEVHG